MTKQAGTSPLRTVHKFGGASVKDADAIRRIGDLLGATSLQ
jgi:aspartokinase